MVQNILEIKIFLTSPESSTVQEEGEEGRNKDYVLKTRVVKEA